MTQVRRRDSSSRAGRNRTGGAGVRVAAFVSALLLSLLVGLLYNAWKYEVERITMEEGSWQSRFEGEFDADVLAVIRSDARVKEVAVREGDAQGRGAGVEITFDRMGCALSATQRIAARAGVPADRIAYNRELLAMYMIRDPDDSAPRLLLPLFLLISAAAALSLVIVIHSAFAVSMGAQVRQLGVLASVGATPRQIRSRLLREAAARCAAPVALGNLLGAGICAALLRAVNRLLGSDVPSRHAAVFGYPPLALAAAVLLTVGTIWTSAWLPARKLGKLTPLEAIRGAREPQPGRGRREALLGLLFGPEGELAGGALRAQRRALRTASLSLTLSLLAFAAMQCFVTLSDISTRETYFERYRDVWDVQVTVRGADVDEFSQVEAIRSCPGVRSAIAYQRVAAERIVAEGEMSEELKALGGFAAGEGRTVSRAEGGWLVSAPLVILDDASFLSYCEQAGIAPALDGAVIWNRVRDAGNLDFRHPRFAPYVTGEGTASALRRSGGGGVAAELPVLGYADAAPPLREEYATLDPYELVHFVPASLWREIKGRFGAAEAETRVCVLGREGATMEELDALQEEIDGLLTESVRAQSENRLREAALNDRQIRGTRSIFGGFCALLALIGIGGVFSNALGFVRQRRREFARYMSVGMTPGEIRRMFCIEGFALAGRPMLFALPLAAAAVGAMLKASYVAPGEFLAEAPLGPVALFALAIWGAVALAYFLGWRSLSKLRLAELLRDDGML